MLLRISLPPGWPALFQFTVLTGDLVSKGSAGRVDVHQSEDHHAGRNGLPHLATSMEERGTPPRHAEPAQLLG